MTWSAVYREDTRDLVSVCTVVAEPLPPGLAVADLGAERPDMAVRAWDRATLSMVARVRPPDPPGRGDRIVTNVKGRATLPAPLEAHLRAALAEEGVE